MKTPELLILIALVVLFIIMIYYYSKCSQRFVKILFGFCSGIVILYPVQLALQLFGISIGINMLTVSISAILGIPGVALIVALSII